MDNVVPAEGFGEVLVSDNNIVVKADPDFGAIELFLKTGNKVELNFFVDVKQAEDLCESLLREIAVMQGDEILKKMFSDDEMNEINKVFREDDGRKD